MEVVSVNNPSIIDSLSYLAALAQLWRLYTVNLEKVLVTYFNAFCEQKTKQLWQDSQ
jgi:hypothetical protein